MDLRTATNYLGYTFEGYPEEPITKTTYDRAVTDGMLTNWKDLNGSPVTTPSWGQIVSAYNSGVVKDNADKQAKADRVTKIKDRLTGMTLPQLNAYIENNVTADASVKAYLKRLTAIVRDVAKEQGK